MGAGGLPGDECRCSCPFFSPHNRSLVLDSPLDQSRSCAAPKPSCYTLGDAMVYSYVMGHQGI